MSSNITCKDVFEAASLEPLESYSEAQVEERIENYLKEINKSASTTTADAEKSNEHEHTTQHKRQVNSNHAAPNQQHGA